MATVNLGTGQYIIDSTGNLVDVATNTVIGPATQFGFTPSQIDFVRLFPGSSQSSVINSLFPSAAQTVETTQPIAPVAPGIQYSNTLAMPQQVPATATVNFTIDGSNFVKIDPKTGLAYNTDGSINTSVSQTYQMANNISGVNPQTAFQQQQQQAQQQFDSLQAAEQQRIADQQAAAAAAAEQQRIAAEQAAAAEQQRIAAEQAARIQAERVAQQQRVDAASIVDPRTGQKLQNLDPNFGNYVDATTFKNTQDVIKRIEDNTITNVFTGKKVQSVEPQAPGYVDANTYNTTKVDIAKAQEATDFAKTLPPIGPNTVDPIAGPNGTTFYPTMNGWVQNKYVTSSDYKSSGEIAPLVQQVKNYSANYVEPSSYVKASDFTPSVVKQLADLGYKPTTVNGESVFQASKTGAAGYLPDQYLTSARNETRAQQEFNNTMANFTLPDISQSTSRQDIMSPDGRTRYVGIPANPATGSPAQWYAVSPDGQSYTPVSGNQPGYGPYYQANPEGGAPIAVTPTAPTAQPVAPEQPAALTPVEPTIPKLISTPQGIVPNPAYMEKYGVTAEQVIRETTPTAGAVAPVIPSTTTPTAPATQPVAPPPSMSDLNKLSTSAEQAISSQKQAEYLASIPFTEVTTYERVGNQFVPRTTRYQTKDQYVQGYTSPEELARQQKIASESKLERDFAVKTFDPGKVQDLSLTNPQLQYLAANGWQEQIKGQPVTGPDGTVYYATESGYKQSSNPDAPNYVEPSKLNTERQQYDQKFTDLMSATKNYEAVKLKLMGGNGPLNQLYGPEAANNMPPIMDIKSASTQPIVIDAKTGIIYTKTSSGYKQSTDPTVGNFATPDKIQMVLPSITKDSAPVVDAQGVIHYPIQKTFTTTQTSFDEIPFQVESGWVQSANPDAPGYVPDAGAAYQRNQYDFSNNQITHVDPTQIKTVPGPGNIRYQTVNKYGANYIDPTEESGWVQREQDRVQLAIQYEESERRNRERIAAMNDGGGWGFFGDLFEGIDKFVNKTVGWDTIATIAGGLIGGPWGATLANATANAIQGETPAQILKSAALTFATAYGTKALSEALNATVSEAVNNSIAEGTIDSALVEQAADEVAQDFIGEGLTDYLPDVVTEYAPAETIGEEFIPEDILGPIGPEEALTPVTEVPTSPVQPNAPVDLTSTGVSDMEAGTIFEGPNGDEIVLDSGKTVNYEDYLAAQNSGQPVSIDGQMTTGGTVTVGPAPSEFANMEPIAPTWNDVPSIEITGVGSTGEAVLPDVIVNGTIPGLTTEQIVALGGLTAAAAVVAASGIGGAQAAAAAAGAPTTPPTPVEPTPVEPTPTPPAPVEPTPTQPGVVEPTPTTPAPVEPTPNPTPTPVEPGPTTPMEPTPTEPGTTTPTEPGTTTPTEPVPPAPVPGGGTPTPTEPTVPGTTTPGGEVTPGPTEPVTPVEPTTPTTPTEPVTPPAEEVPVIDKSTPYEGPYSNESVLERYLNKTITYGDVLKLIAAGLVLPSVLPLLGIQPKPPAPRTYGPLAPIQWGTANGMTLPGLNPGYLTFAGSPPPMYQTTDKVQSQYYWGMHPYMRTQEDLVNYNLVPEAPAVPFGIQQSRQPFNTQQFIEQTIGTPRYQQAAMGGSQQYPGSFAPATSYAGGPVAPSTAPQPQTFGAPAPMPTASYAPQQFATPVAPVVPQVTMNFTPVTVPTTLPEWAPGTWDLTQPVTPYGTTPAPVQA